MIDFKTINESLDSAEKVMKALFRFTVFLVAVSAWLLMVWALARVVIKLG